MPVEVINQPTTATARTNFIIEWVIKLMAPSVYPTPAPGPSNALQTKPWGFDRQYGVTTQRMDLDLPYEWENRSDWQPIYVKRNGPKSKRLFLYYHGGGFVNMIAMPQWQMAARLASELEADFVVQTYIMTPHGGIQQNIEKLVYNYQKIRDLAQGQGQEFIIGGDSAGGSITAAVLLALNNKSVPLPDQAIMLAPALVGDYDLPENRALEPVDPVLGIDQYSGSVRAWGTGPTDRANLFKPAPPPTAEQIAQIEHPYAAPLKGNWEFAAKAKLPITLSQGTYDILCPQVDQFVEMAKSLDLELTYIRADKACHVYPMLAELPGASFLAPDSIEGMRLIVQSVKRYSKL